MRTVYAFCTLCKTHRFKITEEFDEFDGSRFWAYHCACGTGGFSSFKPQALIEYQKEQDRERSYHDGLEGVV